MEPNSAAAKKTFKDNEECGKNSGITSQLAAGEKIVFSCKVIKHNKWTMR